MPQHWIVYNSFGPCSGYLGPIYDIDDEEWEEEEWEHQEKIGSTKMTQINNIIGVKNMATLRRMASRNWQHPEWHPDSEWSHHKSHQYEKEWFQNIYNNIAENNKSCLTITSATQRLPLTSPSTILIKTKEIIRHSI